MIKGKTPTQQNSREMMNPIIFNLEFTMMDVTKLKYENVHRAYNYLMANKGSFHIKALQELHPAGKKILEWINIVIMKSHWEQHYTDLAVIYNQGDW